MAAFSRWFKQAFCDHAVYLDDIKRVDAELVIAKCCRCGTTLQAPFGLALEAKLLQRSKENDDDV